jgi:hypothetical protein
MANKENTEKAEPKGSRKQPGNRKQAGGSKADTSVSEQSDAKAGEPTAGQAQVVKKMLTRLEAKMDSDRMKATMGDYFPNDGLGTNFSGMPFYDAGNLATFETQYGHPLAAITQNTVDPAAYPDEVAYLTTVIGNFTTAIMTFVRDAQPACRFEVLYPTDVNQTDFNRAINYPAATWTPATLTCLKTEAFGFTFGRNLDKSWETLDFGDALGFTAAQRSHLVGVGDSTTAWLKEVRGAEGKRFESVVLFALDQFCLIGYDVPLPDGLRRSFRIGG